MSCGCTAQGQDRDLQLTAAVMCATCRHRRSSSCSKLNRPAEVVVIRRNCPLGRHPDDQGIVRWMGLRHRGVPAYKRIGFDHVDLPGCGCIDGLKSWTERVGAWASRAMRWRWVPWATIAIMIVGAAAAAS